MYTTLNKRIEAYLKSHLQREYHNSYGEVVEDAHYFMYQEDIDGLVALIVKECASVLDEQTIPSCHPIASPSARLKAHFGLE